MSQNNQDQEIDLLAVGQKISTAFDHLGKSIYNLLGFVKKNIIVISVLFIVGAVAGHFIDKNNNAYVSKIIVVPNFGSVDDLYAKVDLLQARLSANDTVFLKSVGIINDKKVGGITVEPILDVYGLINNNIGTTNNAQNTQNFEMVKLLSENSDINKVIKDDLTSKQYAHHQVKVTSDGQISNEKHIQPILNFLNSSDYFIKIQKEFINNVQVKLKENQVIIGQIDGLLNQFASNTTGAKNDKLVYYNENTQLNDVIINKNNLIAENGNLRLQLINYQKVVKENSIVLNQKNNKGLNGKMGKVLPILFLMLFFGFSILISIYKSFNKKYA